MSSEKMCGILCNHFNETKMFSAHSFIVWAFLQQRFWNKHQTGFFSTMVARLANLEAKCVENEKKNDKNISYRSVIISQFWSTISQKIRKSLNPSVGVLLFRKPSRDGSLVIGNRYEKKHMWKYTENFSELNTFALMASWHRFFLVGCSIRRPVVAFSMF